MNIFQSSGRYLPAVLLPLLIGLLFYQCKHEVQSAGTLNVRMEAAPKGLNPLITTSAYTQYVSARILQSLAGLSPKTLEMEPVLVKKIPTIRQVSDGPHKGSSAYDFEILDEAVWDNGSPITANDLLFTLKVIFHPGIPSKFWRGYFEYLDAVEPDPANSKKFTVYFKQFYILNLESICQTPIFPAYHYDPQNHLGKIALSDLIDEKKAESLKDDPVMKAFADEFMLPKYANDKDGVSGSGPYKLESINEQGPTLVKKEHWWGDALADRYELLTAYPQRLVYKVIQDDGILENMLRTEALDVASAVTPAKFLEWGKDTAFSRKYDFVKTRAPQYNHIMLNAQNQKLSDKRVRQALAYTVDYDYLINTVIQGMGTRNVGPINPIKAYYAKDIPLYDFNIQKAKSLLTEAGWSDSDGNGIVDKTIDGKVTDLSVDMLCTCSVKVSEMISNSVQQTALQAGIKINIIPIDISELSKQTRAGEFEAALFANSINSGLDDLYQQFHSSNLAPAGDNRSHFANPHADSLISAVRTCPDETRRNVMYVEIQRILHDEVPEVFLFIPDQRTIVSKKFKYVLSSNKPAYYENMFELIK